MYTQLYQLGGPSPSKSLQKMQKSVPNRANLPSQVYRQNWIMYANLAQLWDPTWPPKSIEKLPPKWYNVFLSGPNWVPKPIEKLTKTAATGQTGLIWPPKFIRNLAKNAIMYANVAQLWDPTWPPKSIEKLDQLGPTLACWPDILSMRL